MPRGTAFLKYKDKASADLVLQTVNDGHDQPPALTQNQNKKDKKDKKSECDILKYIDIYIYMLILISLYY